MSDEHAQPGEAGDGEPRTTDQAEHAPPMDPPEADLHPQTVEAPEPKALEKADLTKRAIAAIIDGVVAAVVGVVPGIGGIIGAGYMLVRDGLPYAALPHRSLGKKLVGLQAVTLEGEPLDLMTSVRRNWPFVFGGIAQALLVIPLVGWLLAALLTPIAIGAALIELFLVVTDENGRRLGDKTADTMVVDMGDGQLPI